MDETQSFSVKETAKLLNVTKAVVYYWIHQKALRAYRQHPFLPKSSWRIPDSEVQRILEARRLQLEGKDDVVIVTCLECKCEFFLPRWQYEITIEEEGKRWEFTCSDCDPSLLP